MIPSPWVGLVLALATFRAWRLIGWDDFPLVLRLRGWATGEHEVTAIGASQVAYRYRRPTLAHFLGCAYCSGAWLSLGVYLAWLGEPSWTLYGCAPFALSAAVGIVARRLDP